MIVIKKINCIKYQGGHSNHAISQKTFMDGLLGLWDFNMILTLIGIAFFIQNRL
ncbi:hypothetical protein ACJX0J_028491, partial [Zea mays]